MYIPKWVGSGSSNPGSGMQPWKDPVRHILGIASINSLQVTQSYIMYSHVSFPLSLPCAGLAEESANHEEYGESKRDCRGSLVDVIIAGNCPGG